MCLKLIKLAGFKSFVDPTLITVNRQVNAIVGPNGCGKSNVVDAIRWVIGEISAKKLRGQSMSDVIFAGTTGRKPVGKASVELVFDNSEGRFGGEYASFGEFSIRREVTRDGNSDYYINNAHCRRRDVLDLFMGTGLGSRSYSVIEQGMISQLIEAKPEDLRSHIGEAAGISKYKERRRETEVRIQHTRDNLDRLNDLRDEIDKQLRHLQRQASAAKKFKEYQSERTELNAQVKAMQWREIDRKLDVQDKQIIDAKVQRESLYEQVRSLEVESQQLRDQQSGLNDALQQKQQLFYDISNQISQLEQSIRSNETTLSRSSDEQMDNESAQDEYRELVLSYEQKIEDLDNQLGGLLPQKNEVEDEKESASFALAQAEIAMTRWRESSDHLQSELMQQKTQQNVCKAKIEHFEDQLINHEERQISLHHQLSELNIDELVATITPMEQALKEAQMLRDEKQQKQQALRDEQQGLRNQLQSLRHEQKETQKELSRQERELATQQARQEAALTKDDAATHAFIDQQGLTKRPRLAETLTVDPKWQRAVEAVLQPQLDAICVQHVFNYTQAIESLKSGHLLLIDETLERHTWKPRLAKPTLLEQVHSKWPLTSWLKEIYVADSIAEALAMRPSLAVTESVITPDGHWIGFDWWQIHIPAESAHSILGRESFIAQLQKDVQALMEQLESRESAILRVEDQLSNSEKALDTMQQEVSAASQQLVSAEQALNLNQSRLDALFRQREQSEKELLQLDEKIARIKEDLEKNKHQLEAVNETVPELESENAALLARREELSEALARAQQVKARADQKAGELMVQVSACENQLQLLQDSHRRDEKRLAGLIEREQELQAVIDELLFSLPEMREQLQSLLVHKEEAAQALREHEERRNSQNWQSGEQEAKRKELQQLLDVMQEKLTQLQMEREGLYVRQTTVVEQLEEAGVDLQVVLTNLPEELNLKEQEEKLQNLSDAIARLGAINLAAIEEFDAAKERQDYLNNQYTDLVEALNMLETAIEKIDRESRQKFKETFEQINANFQKLFPEVFGGGSATLELTENDWLNAGVVVKAQPPGKRNSTIHMLSGGEKALTAMALVFSMFRLNPAPFCILDEVDAPLDDLNVGRYSDLVRRMAADTQFIMISHNKLAIAMADQLLGITMQEPGVSRLVNVNISEAMEMVEA
jgi:chromosome segregation protein